MVSKESEEVGDTSRPLQSIFRLVANLFPDSTEMAADRGMMTVSVIIPVKNDTERLRLCMRQLLETANHQYLREVLVVDNESEPALTNEWSDPRVSVLRCPQGGSYAARNVALLRASGEVLAFTDSDCVPAPDWLENGLVGLRTTGADALAGRIEVFPRQPECPSSVELYEMMFSFPQQNYVKNNDFGATANLLIRRSAIDVAGAFDPKLSSGGDREWGRRAKTCGLKMVYEPQCVIRHPARQTERELYAKIERVIRGLRLVDFQGTGAVGEARRRSWQARRFPLGAFVRVFRTYRTQSLRQRWGVCLVILKVRSKISREYHLLAAELHVLKNSGPPLLG